MVSKTFEERKGYSWAVIVVPSTETGLWATQFAPFTYTKGRVQKPEVRPVQAQSSVNSKLCYRYKAQELCESCWLYYYYYFFITHWFHLYCWMFVSQKLVRAQECLGELLRLTAQYLGWSNCLNSTWTSPANVVPDAVSALRRRDDGKEW